MILVGENIHVISPRVAEAFKARDGVAVRDMARTQAEAGMDRLDLNIGPARKDGPKLMRWLVGEVCQACELPVSLDTTNAEAIEAGLEVLAEIGRGGLINSCSVMPQRMERLLPLAAKFGAPVIALLWGSDGLPRDANERGALAAEFLYQASAAGIPPENVWIDPILCPIKGQQEQLVHALEFMEMLPEMAPGCGSICGLSNISSGVPGPLRGWLNRTYFIMLKRAGLSSAIVNAFDSDLARIARGERPDLEALVQQVAEGHEPDPSALTPEQTAYVKTARVILGRSLFSDSWLEV
ncbi:MAG: dihydropteroate synthase [Pseudomonadota bacterium]